MTKLPATIEEQRAQQNAEHEKREARVKALRYQFDGAIRYYPMLEQHPDWSDEQCVAFAMKWHAVAVKQFKQNGPARWNMGIPYCRNDHTKAKLDA